MSDQADLDEDELSAFADMFPHMFGGAGGPTIAALGEASPQLKNKLSALELKTTLAAFAALLTLPDLQKNCLRCEALVHLAVSFCGGSRKPHDKAIAGSFVDVATGWIGRSEDPPEDVFVGSIRTRRGNFRLLEGMWEANSFHLQHFVATLETMPDDGPFGRIKRSTFALLSISEMLCARLNLHRHSLGPEVGEHALGRRHLAALPFRRVQLKFTIKDLNDLGFNERDLEPFLFDLKKRDQLLQETLGNTLLERCPLIKFGDEFIVALPTCLGAAVRYFAIDMLQSMGRLGTFLANNAKVQSALLSEMPLLGGKIGAPIDFAPLGAGAIAEFISEIDRGRFLHVLLVTDNLGGFEETGLGGINPNSAALGEIVSERILHARGAAGGRTPFIDGMTLVVSCGIGRGMALAKLTESSAAWRVEAMSAYDLTTLSWASDFLPTTLWKILEAEDALQAVGIDLFNVNGLLNLVAWSRSLDGHLVPHGSIPARFTSGGVAGTVMVTQNALRQLRHEVAITHDPQVALTAAGEWLRIRRDHLSIFKDDEDAPCYASEDTNDVGKPMSVFLAPRHVWWADTRQPSNLDGGMAYERWRMVSVWLSRAAPVLDSLPGLPEGPLHWRAEFEGVFGDFPKSPLDYKAARRAIRVEIDLHQKIVTTIASPDFDRAIFNEENIAERALVDAMIEGFERLAQAPADDARHAAMLAAIIPNSQARNSHAFYSQGFRDEVRNSSDPVVKVEAEDDSRLRIGLGWKALPEPGAARVIGKQECVSFLNSLASSLAADLEADLKVFDRKECIRALLNNHEAAAQDRDRWNRTASAVLALHGANDDTLQKFAQHEFSLNAVFLGTRLCAEFANCACPVGSGRAPGALDLSRLMAKAGLLFQVGGWSDAIRWDVMPPKVLVTPLGDVLAGFEFVEDIVAPHARAASDVRVSDAVENYPSQLEERPFVASTGDEALSPVFQLAWREQFGATFDEVRAYLDFLEDKGRAADALVFEAKRSELENAVVDGQQISAPAVTNILRFLSSLPTDNWAVLPSGFEPRDRHPWRFRRRLSVLRRPLLQIDDAADPTMLVAPGLVREAIAYQLNGYYRGDFPSEQLAPAMKAWKAKEADRRGKAFAADVGEKLRALGWKAEEEVRVSKLLAQGFARDYGDVDVLAWRPDDGRVLIIECKDVQYRKTYGEIAEQLSDFRGELRANGRPDYLRRHLDRYDLISKHIEAVKGYVGAGGAVSLESHLVFRNPVPMEFALKRISERVEVRNFEQLSSL